MEQFVEYADPIQTNMLFITAIKGYMDWNFSQWPYQNGLIGNLYGPVEGRRHDAGILKDSGLMIYQELNLTQEVKPFACMGIQHTLFVPI